MMEGGSTINLQTQAGELARRLGSLQLFRAAATELLDGMRALRYDTFRTQYRKVRSY